MLRLNFQMDRQVVTFMLELVMTVCESLDAHPPDVDVLGEDDPELQEALTADLREGLREDCELLLGILQDPALDDGEIHLPEEHAEAAIRASSAVRLRLRESSLKDVTNEHLERGQVDLLNLPMDQQKAYACYVFLAGLQTLFVEALDPESGDDGLWEEPGAN